MRQAHGPEALVVGTVSGRHGRWTQQNRAPSIARPRFGHQRTAWTLRGRGAQPRACTPVVVTGGRGRTNPFMQRPAASSVRACRPALKAPGFRRTVSRWFLVGGSANPLQMAREYRQHMMDNPLAGSSGLSITGTSRDSISPIGHRCERRCLVGSAPSAATEARPAARRGRPAPKARATRRQCA
jgi:hypothetical protein